MISTAELLDLVHRSAERGITVATAESLTAGGLAARIADIPGSSAVLRGGVIAYCNEVKSSMLGVPAELLELHGAVDARVATAMAQGAAIGTEATVGLATTGVAGPDPHQGKAVGTVYVGIAANLSSLRDQGMSFVPTSWTRQPGNEDKEVSPGISERHKSTSSWFLDSILLKLDGDRTGIRQATVQASLKLLADFLDTVSTGIEEEG